MNFLLILLFGFAGKGNALMNLDVIISAVISWPSTFFVYIGILLTATGAAMNNISNGPPIIRAVAEDGMLPKLFDFLKGENYKALYFTVVLVLTPISFGSLNEVAPLVTIFFLLCYGGVNTACFLLDWLGSPNWRPKWRYYHKATAFCGIILCVTSMLIISWWASLCAIIGALLLYVYLDKKSLEKNWGDGV